MATEYQFSFSYPQITCVHLHYLSSFPTIPSILFPTSQLDLPGPGSHWSLTHLAGQSVLGRSAFQWSQVSTSTISPKTSFKIYDWMSKPFSINSYKNRSLSLKHAGLQSVFPQSMIPTAKGSSAPAHWGHPGRL